jgi:uncharacterized protein (TIGR03435 family)
MFAVSVGCGTAVCQAPAFEVASVKPSPPMVFGPGRSNFIGGPKTDAGRATWSNVPLRYYVMQAYGLTIAWRIEGGPNWFTSDNFDIVGTFPAGTSKEQTPLILKTLLADRFKLAAHTEMTGLKIKESADDDSSMTSRMGAGHMELHKVTMQRVADLLSGTTLKTDDRPVVDMTGLKGLYDVTLDWADDGQTDKPSLFTAVAEQLGLRLEAQKAPVEILVIDHAEKPSEN